MKRTFILWGLIILLLSVSLFAAWFTFRFYFVFENSDQLFRIKHYASRHLEAYTDQWSYMAGEEVILFVSSSSEGEVVMDVFSVVGKDTLIQNQTFIASYQSVDSGASVSGASWSPSHQFSIPATTSSGWYVIRLTKGALQYHCSIFIKPQAPQKRIAYLFSTNTWNAYNYWGGQSLYTKNYTPTVSFLRPQLLANPFLEPSMDNISYAYQSAVKDRYVHTWLKETGFGCDAYSMTDLHQTASWLKQYDIAIISTHSEYWTGDMLDHLNAFLAEGGSLLSLSGNTAAWRTYMNSSADSLTVYKQKGGLWLSDSIRGRPFGTNLYFKALHTYAPYQVWVDTSWVFKGTSLHKGDIFGKISDTYDPTHMYANWWQNFWGIFAGQKMTMASGMEVDRVNRQTPKNWITVAGGLNPAIDGMGYVYPHEPFEWSGEGGAHMGYYQHPGGGLVFNVSSVAFTGAIPYDEQLQQILYNVLEKMKTLKNPPES